MSLDYASMDIGAIRAGLRAREFSARELAEHALWRARAANTRLNAFLEISDELALAAAARIDDAIAAGSFDQLGPLAGVPMAFKDNMNLRGTRTTCASRMLEGYVSPYTATCIQKVLDAGAIPLGKLNLDEFAFGSSTETSAFGPTRNPWDETRVPGGSSGGSAAAVAAGLVPVSLGTDTGGSIRQPASLCGVVGVKPSYGAVSRYGVVAFGSSLDQVGPLTRSVRDAALVLNALAGRDARDATSRSCTLDFTANLAAGVSGMRIGMVPAFLEAAGLQAEVRDAVEQAAYRLGELGAQLVEVELPHAQAAMSAYYVLGPCEAFSNLSRFDGIRYGHCSPGHDRLDEQYASSRAAGFGPEVSRRMLLGSYLLSSGVYDTYYYPAQQVRTLITQDYSRAFERCDCILAPVSPRAAWRFGELSDSTLRYLADMFTVSINIAGNGGMSVPVGLGADSGLPIGVQLIAPAFHDENMLRVAAALEQAYGPACVAPSYASTCLEPGASLGAPRGRESASPGAAGGQESASRGASRIGRPVSPGAVDGYEPASRGTSRSDESASPDVAGGQEPATPGTSRSDGSASPGTADDQEPASQGASRSDGSALPDAADGCEPALPNRLSMAARVFARAPETASRESAFVSPGHLGEAMEDCRFQDDSGDGLRAGLCAGGAGGFPLNAASGAGTAVIPPKMSLREALRDWEAVIGLEVHCALTALSTKMFCGCAQGFGAPPNTHTCPMCLGLPGALPVPNRAAVESAVLAGLATDCRIMKRSLFYRKGYLYPDLPKGYQITQGPVAFCMDGHLDLLVEGEAATERMDWPEMREDALAGLESPGGAPAGYITRIGIERIHLEEDAGKMVHLGGGEGRIAGATCSLVDFNRAGTPLIELVTRPDLRTPEEARLFLQKLRQLFLALGISDCSMEAGSLRADGNVSLRRRGSTQPGVKTELKNLNSFKYLHDGLAYEICRQAAVLSAGGTIRQETRHWDPSAKRSIVMRVKETADDYRMFPDPDLTPFELDDAFVDAVRARLPELPDQKAARLTVTFGLPAADACLLVEQPETCAFFERCMEIAAAKTLVGGGGRPAARQRLGEGSQAIAKRLANLLLNEVAALMSRDATFDLLGGPLTFERALQLVQLVEAGNLSTRQAKEVLAAVIAEDKDPAAVIDERGMKQLNDAAALQSIVESVLAAHPDQVASYRTGKTGLLGYFVGQCMKLTHGQANPQLTNELLKKALGEARQGRM